MSAGDGDFPWRTKSPAEMAALPKSPVDLARKLFAQVFSGVHW